MVEVHAKETILSCRHFFMFKMMKTPNKKNIGVTIPGKWSFVTDFT